MAGKKGAFRFSAVLEKSSNRLWGAHFRVPAQLVEKVRTSDRRVVCTLNGLVEFQCALLPQRGGVHVISVNKKVRDTLRLTIGTKVAVMLRKDESEYGLPVPEEMAELLRQDRHGSLLFHRLTRGRQRTLLYIIGSVKDPERRVVRSIAVLSHLKANDGRINYRQLYTAIQEKGRR
jgi:hypothetical protein